MSLRLNSSDAAVGGGSLSVGASLCSADVSFSFVFSAEAAFEPFSFFDCDEVFLLPMLDVEDADP